jgi:lycopene cyclase domain-containing protein
MNNLYLWLNIGTLIGPFLLSFDKKVTFYKEWKYLFPSILMMAIVFVTWDVLFTINGVWGFNPDYLTGYYLFSLPIEEWLFFFTVPYACVFIYACVKAYFSDFLMQYGKLISTVLAMVFLLIGSIFLTNLYTSITFISTGLFLLLLLKSTAFSFGRFWVAYGISLLPFLLVNGVLTGTGIDSQVVWYNADHIMNIRVFTIPVEDSVYNMLMLLMTIFFYETFKYKKVW